ncbi:MAG: hypothetical protein LBS50_05675 [Prevotellaceae bacterium]|jgi:acetyl-CoA synthetase|nr:hypothetical protein [Prevotellaceae bacterium]
MFNFGYDIIDRRAAEFPNEIAVKYLTDNDFTLKISNADLHHHSDITAYFLQRIGVKAGSRVLLCGLENWFEITLIISALHKLCATIVFDLLQKPVDCCNKLGVYAIISANNSPVIEQVTQNIDQLQTVETLISVGNPCPEKWLDLHAGTRFAKPFKPLQNILQNQTSLIIFDEKAQFFDENYPLFTKNNYIWDKFYRNMIENKTFNF